MRSLAYVFAVGVGTLATVYLAYVASAANTTIGNNISTSGTLTVGNTALFSSTLRASSTLQVTGTTTLYGALASQSSATSTFINGLNLSGGCFAINGTCLTGGGGGGAGTVNSGTIGQIAFYESAGTAVSGTSTISINTAGNITFSGNLLPSASAASTSVASATTTLDSNTNTNYTSLAIGSDNFPVIAYYDGNNQDLIVTKCGNASCTSGNASTTVDSTDDVGQYASIAVPSDGLPIISYYDATNDDLKVVKCGNSACSSGNTITVLDSASGGIYTSIAIGNDDLAVISYTANTQITNGDLKVAKCGNADCSSSTQTIVDAAGDTGYGTYIIVPSDGLPVISYRSESGQGSVRMAKCGNASCSSGNQNNFIADAGTNGVGTWTSIAVGPQGLPLIVYQKNTSDKTQLGVVECSNSSCSEGLNTQSVIEIESGSDIEMSVAIGGDGLPVIVTTTSDNISEIAVGIKCGNSSCSFANQINKFDYNVNTNSLSMKLGSDGFPVAVYQSSGSFGLVFAKCNDEACSHSFGSVFTGGSDLGSQNKFFHNAYIESVFANQIKIKRFDLAEDYFSKENLDPGMIVALDPGYSLYVEKASQARQGRVIGVISSEPALVLSDYLMESEDARYPVALAGRVPVKVNTEGGVINIGDPITLSSEPGVGKRASEDSVVVGYALENYSGQIDGKILAFVDLGQPQMTAESLLSQAISAMKSWMEGALVKVKELFADKVKTKSLELIDSVTGEVYCVGIANGEWQRTLGECSQEEMISEETASSTPEQPELNGPSQAPPPPPGLSSPDPETEVGAEQ